MSKRRAISEYRNIVVTFVGGEAAPIDAYKAAIEAATVSEGRYMDLGATGVPDLTDKAILVTGAVPFQIHSFTLTTVMADGSYAFTYVETKPNTDA